MVAGISDKDLDEVKSKSSYFLHGGPDLKDGFDLLTEVRDPLKDKDGLKVWRRAGKGGIFEYLVIGAAPYSMETFFRVLEDLEFHKEWDSYCADLKIVDAANGTDFIYWEVKYPLLFTNRDYIYARRHRKESDGSHVFVTQATEHKDHPEMKHKIRVVDYFGSYILRPRATVMPHTHSIMPVTWILIIGNPKLKCLFPTLIHFVRLKDPQVTEYVYSFFDDPRGNIPKKIVNWVVSTAIPGFMKDLYNACDRLSNKLEST